MQAYKGDSFLSILNHDDADYLRRPLAVKVNGTLRDLSSLIEGDASVVPVTFETSEGREIFWHSGAHLMAHAVRRLFPEAKFAIGPAIENGFYYDIDMKHVLTPEDLLRIENVMAEIRDEDHEIRRVEMPRSEAVTMFAELGQTYKVEMLNEMKDETVSMYRQGEFVDLCRGPHVPRTSYLRCVKLLSLAGAYWRGDEKQPMLQRIYGTAFPDEDRLNQYLRFLEEARERDHRKLGRELDLFSFSQEVGAGLPLWHPNGAMLRFIIETFSTQEHLKRGYRLFSVPHIARAELYRTSGHLDFYHENMYAPIRIDEQDYYLKPMNCPSQIQIFNSTVRSYRELPFRGFEMGTVYRYERSGVLHGLTRVRGFTQDDAHIFCTPEQLEGEIREVLDFTIFMLETFGFSERAVYLSTRPEHSVGSDEGWELATRALKNTLDDMRVAYAVDPGEGVFYGPKIDIKIKDAIGREWQCSTIQVDFNLPERFDVNYIGPDGKKHRPIMIHRALLGSLERFIGILIEHYGGRFPVWLAPVQMVIINVSEQEAAAAEELKVRFLQEGFRPEIDCRDESMGYRVRDAIARKAPYILVIGKREVADGTLSVRRRGEKTPVTMTVDAFVDAVRDDVSTRR